MTRKTIVVLANESTANVPARRDDFAQGHGTYGSTTGFSVASVGSVSVGKSFSSNLIGHHAAQFSSGKPSPATLSNGVRLVGDLLLTVRPQATQRELVTERLNRSLSLGYMPPLRRTTAK